MLWFRREQKAVEVRLTEIFFRQYQVLEGNGEKSAHHPGYSYHFFILKKGRTHPDMQMDNASGFVLTGIKVEPSVFTGNPNQVVASERVVEKKGKNKGGRDVNNQRKQKEAGDDNASKKKKLKTDDEEEE